jgi:hypothetical protein
LQLLYDYPTNASDMLNKASLEIKAPERGSTILPSSTRNKSNEEFSLFTRARTHRNSDAAFMPNKTSLSAFANDRTPNNIPPLNIALAQREGEMGGDSKALVGNKMV